MKIEMLSADLTSMAGVIAKTGDAKGAVVIRHFGEHAIIGHSGISKIELREVACQLIALCYQDEFESV